MGIPLSEVLLWDLGDLEKGLHLQAMKSDYESAMGAFTSHKIKNNLGK